MTLQQLKYVVALDSYRSFSVAAEHCLVSQPTLTMQLKKLENEMGFSIFNRKKSPLRPTQMGALIVEKARQVLREVEQMQALVRGEQESVEGGVRLGVIPTVGPYLLPLFVGDFIEHNPKTRLLVEEMKSSEIISKLRDGKIDVGLLVTPLDEADLREVPLYYEPFHLFVSPGHPLSLLDEVSPDDVEQADGLWVLNQGHCFRNQVLNICHRPSSANLGRLQYESGSIETLKRLIRTNFGYTLVPELSLDAELDNVRPFAEPQPVREVSLVVHNSFVKERLIEELRREILEAIPDKIRKNRRYIKVRWRS